MLFNFVDWLLARAGLRRCVFGGFTVSGWIDLLFMVYFRVLLVL